MKIYTNYNFLGNAIENALMHPVTALPESAKGGQVCYLSTASEDNAIGLYYYSTKWDRIADAASVDAALASLAESMNSALETHAEEADNKYETKTDASTKLTEAKAYTDSEVKKVSDYVGTFTAQDGVNTVIDYINKKTDGIATSGNLEALGNRVSAIENDYTTEAEAKAYADAKDAAIAEAKEAGTNAQTTADNALAKANANEEAINKLNDTYATDAELAQAKTDILGTGYLTGTLHDAQVAINANSAQLSEHESRIKTNEQTIATIGASFANYATTNDLNTTKDELNSSIDDNKLAISSEVSRATAAEEALAEDIKAISDDYLKAADKSELATEIQKNTAAIELLTNGVDADKVDSVNDLIAYVEAHGSEVTGMQEDIATNATNIAANTEDIDALEAAIVTATKTTTYTDKTIVGTTPISISVTNGIIRNIKVYDSDNNECIVNVKRTDDKNYTLSATGLGTEETLTVVYDVITTVTL